MSWSYGQAVVAHEAAHAAAMRQLQRQRHHEAQPRLIRPQLPPESRSAEHRA
jgi:predicted SprT family Zn-dependent metalloprotease